MWAALLALGAAVAQPVFEESPSEHTVIYYNARMALREGDALEATKLWLLRNALEDQTGRVSPFDEDFHTITWAALGKLGICQDGYPTDESGAGLWPVALHNWVIVNRGRRGKTGRSRPFQAFELGRQQRFVSIGDVLGTRELQNVTLQRGGCTRPKLAILNAGHPPMADLSDRMVSARVLQYLLERARTTMRADRIKGLAAIEARLFDLYLQQTSLAAQRARMDSSLAARIGREIGMSRDGIDDMRADAPTSTLSPESRAAKILEASVEWPVEEWMALSPDRRLFLYDHAKNYGADPQAMDAIALGVIDELIADGDGTEVEKWIAHRSEELSAQEVIWSGDRGLALMALDRESGFQERAVIALHRGVNQLERGDLPGALRSWAYALQHAPDSRAGDEVQSLALRWMSYVGSQFEITDELLLTLRQLVPRRDYQVLLEDLMWGAALRADRPSFDRGERNQVGRGALGRRMTLLEPLADGNIGGFTGQIREGLDRSPSETLRFLDTMVQRLEAEDASVRAAHVPTLKRLLQLLAPFTAPDAKGRQSMTANDLSWRITGMLDGLGGLGESSTSADRARSMDPRTAVFAGAVRLAPSDPLPWPFRAAEVPAPSVYTQLELIPREWKDERGRWVLGWSIEG